MLEHMHAIKRNGWLYQGKKKKKTKMEAMDGCVQYLSLMSLAAWRGRGGEKGDTKRRDNWVWSQWLLSSHLEQNMSRGGSVTPERRKTFVLCQFAAGRQLHKLPVWSRPFRRSKASDWPAPAAPPNSPALWSRRSADSEWRHKHYKEAGIAPRDALYFRNLHLQTANQMNSNTAL